MLGFTPLAAAPLAATSALLITIASPILATGGITFSGSTDGSSANIVSATGGITFAGTAAAGLGVSLAATGGLVFGGSPVWTSLNALTTSAGITFNGSPILKAAGRPIIITALPDSYTIRADRVSFDITALPHNFTLKGVP